VEINIHLPSVEDTITYQPLGLSADVHDTSSQQSHGMSCHAVYLPIAPSLVFSDQFALNCRPTRSTSATVTAILQTVTSLQCWASYFKK